MSLFRREEVEIPDVRAALKRADPHLAASVERYAADRFGKRDTLEQKKSAHANLTNALNAAIMRVYELAELHRDSTEDLLDAATRGRADVEAKLKFIDEIERSLKGGNDANNSGSAPAGDGNGRTGGGQESPVPSVPDAAAGGAGLSRQEAQVSPDQG